MSFLPSDNLHLSEPTTPPPLAQQNDLPIPDSDGAIARYLEAAISDNTQRAYASDLRHFLAWGGTVPATDRLVAAYLAAHAGSLSIATLTRRLATISKAHKMKGITSATASELVRMTMQGIRRVHGKPQRRVAAAVIVNAGFRLGPENRFLRTDPDLCGLLAARNSKCRSAETVSHS